MRRLGRRALVDAGAERVGAARRGRGRAGAARAASREHEREHDRAGDGRDGIPGRHLGVPPVSCRVPSWGVPRVQGISQPVAKKIECQHGDQQALQQPQLHGIPLLSPKMPTRLRSYIRDRDQTH